MEKLHNVYFNREDLTLLKTALQVYNIRTYGNSKQTKLTYLLEKLDKLIEENI